MLFSGINEFGWSADNFNSDIFDTTMGTSLTTGAAHTKGSAVQLLSSATVAFDVYEVYVSLLGGRTAGSQRTFLTDILIDPAGGTSYQTLIPNLLSQQNGGGDCVSYYFPVFIPAGSSIAAQGQCNAATISYRAAIRVVGKPSYPELVKAGSVVEAIGVSTATTLGTSLTPGDGVWGSWTSLGTSANNNWWWQCGVACADVTMGIYANALQLSGGDATNKKILVPETIFRSYPSEEIIRGVMGWGRPSRTMPAGGTVYGRIYHQGTADTSYSMTAYGVK